MSRDRITIMEERLQQAFSPSSLEVIDDSEQHKGHAGSQGGAGHYSIIIEANSLANLTRIEAHRKIYAVFADMIPEQIHALRIVVGVK